LNRKRRELFLPNALEDELNKVELLKEKAREFRVLILKLGPTHPRLKDELEPLFLLFDALERGEVTPPLEGKYESPFHLEDPIFGIGTEFLEASAQFRSALEDWPSKAWFPKAKK
jgi:hypothetical protein